MSEIPVRFCPSNETLSVLNDRRWICSYSGGKDSTALVTWIEWLRRVGLVRCETPRLVKSDTGIEYPFLDGISDRLMETLRCSGWECEVVRPRVNERLYCNIFGRGVSPVHPGNRKLMRWCTRSTKIDPMKRFCKTLGGEFVHLSGVRWGESDTRDGKLSAGGCAAGGECGLPAPGNGVYAPIITWKVCKVIEWLEGVRDASIDLVIGDLLPITRGLVDVYEVKREAPNLFGLSPVASALRFGCIGCPAITRSRVIAGQLRKRPELMHLRRIYGIWDELYNYRNRCVRVIEPADGSARFSRHGPIRLQVRKRLFAELLDIQEKSGVTLVSSEDIAFIYDCWDRKVYPRGWSEADELTQTVERTLFSLPLAS